jgi:energy-coupling factor transporter transmembrane protein EcfT
MFEELLDDVAQNSTFRHIHPGTKVLLGLGSLIICLVSPTPVVPLISGVILSLVLLIPVRISPIMYGELLIAPAIFTVMSVVVLLFLLGGRRCDLAVQSCLVDQSHHHNRLTQPEYLGIFPGVRLFDLTLLHRTDDTR